EVVIVCHEKVVRISLEGDEILWVQGECTQGVAKTLLNTKFCIDLVPRATPVAKSPYRLAPSKMQEWSEQLQELQDKGVKDKILATSSETPKVENAPAEMLCDMEQQMEIGQMMVSTLWIKLYSEYEYEIRYHPSKANMVTDVLSRKERVKPRRVRAMAMTIQYGVRGMILAAQSKAFKQENIFAERLYGLDQHMKRKEDEIFLFYGSYLGSIGKRVFRDTIGFEYCLASSSGWTKVNDEFQTLEDIMRACVNDFGCSYHSSIWCAPFDALYGMKCRSPVLWVEIGENCLTGPELVLDTTDNVVLIKEKLKAQRDQIMDREIRDLKRSKIPLVKVHWNSKRGPEFTWEREDHMNSKYPQLFVDRVVESASEHHEDVKAKRSARRDRGRHMELLHPKGLIVTYLRFITNFSKIVKPITSPTERNQKYEWGVEQEEAFQNLKNDLCVKDNILATTSETPKVENAPAEMLCDMDQQMEKRADDAQSEAFKQENVLTERLHGLDQQMERKGGESLYFMDRIWVLLIGSVMDEAHASRRRLQCQRLLACCNSLRYLSENEIESPWILSLNSNGQSDNSKEWNSGDDQLRLRWMIYLVVLADVAESVRDAIGFEYCLASSGGWTKDWESSLIGPELVQEMTDKCVLEKKGKLAPRYVGLFEILERIGLVAYRLRLPEELSSVHDTFHVSNLKKCLADASLHVPLDEIKVDKTLHFVEEPVEIMDREIKKLKRRKIGLVKVRWSSKRGPEFTWEHKDQIRIKYPQLFVDRVIEHAS
ncbi:hypothetical protein Tco_0717545, partial [Tanacetum coccineum]